MKISARPSRGFASDNNSGIHPEILKAIQEANVGHVTAYGHDPYTERAIKKFKDLLGENIAVFFVFGGTGANVTGIQAMARSHHAVICSEVAHIYSDECGAPEKFTGCKLLPVPTKDGKITVDHIKSHVIGIGDEHHVQAKVVSITESTEMGTVYTQKEIREIADYAHANGMILHMDGARIANAAASLEKSLKEITGDAGVDVLSFGGTKNGMMFGEAVIFFNRDLCKDFKFIRKQGMQLVSKMRFVAAQFEALLTDGLWLKNAKRANQMAKRLEEAAAKIPGIRITQKVQANGVFAVVPRERIGAIQDRYFFYVWDPEISEVRWMCSFDTTEKDVDELAAFVKEVVSG